MNFRKTASALVLLAGLAGCSQFSQRSTESPISQVSPEERSFWMDCGGLRTMHKSSFAHYPDKETFERYESKFDIIYKSTVPLEEMQMLLKELKSEINKYFWNNNPPDKNPEPEEKPIHWVAGCINYF